PSPWPAACPGSCPCSATGARSSTRSTWTPTPTGDWPPHCRDWCSTPLTAGAPSPDAPPRPDDVSSTTYENGPEAAPQRSPMAHSDVRFTTGSSATAQVDGPLCPPRAPPAGARGCHPAPTVSPMSDLPPALPDGGKDAVF